MKTILVSGIGAALLFAAPAWSIQDNSLANAQVAAAPAVKPAGSSKMICETDDVTGSLIAKKRTCMTADQWRDYRAALRRDVEHNQDRGSCTEGCGLAGPSIHK